MKSTLTDSKQRSNCVSVFSNEIEENKGYENKSPFVFPFIMIGTALFVGSIVMFLNLEVRLNDLFGNEILTSLGAISITFAHGHAMAMLGNARRYFQVPHPVTAPHTNIGFWNGNRGYYNMTEHLPFFLINIWLAVRADLPCLAGSASIVWGIGRILYTHGYAYEGPAGRSRGFMLSTFASMACLGAALIRNGMVVIGKSS